MRLPEPGTVVVGAVLTAAGLYQLTPLKTACLKRCRNPLDFLVTRWRRGSMGALRLGVEHGAYCVGGCWALMAVLVIAGAVSLIWVVAIALVVAGEKLLPWGHLLGWGGGFGLLGAGLFFGLELADERSRLKVGDAVELQMEPIKNPVTGDETQAAVMLPRGLVFNEGWCATSTHFSVKGEVEFDHSGKNTEYAAFEYAGP